jgi:hypothetical protein
VFEHGVGNNQRDKGKATLVTLYDFCFRRGVLGQIRMFFSWAILVRGFAAELALTLGVSHASQLPDLERWCAAHDGAVEWYRDTFTGKPRRSAANAATRWLKFLFITRNRRLGSRHCSVETP